MPCEKNFLTSDVPGAFGNYKFSIQYGCSVLSLNFFAALEFSQGDYAESNLKDWV